MLIKRILVASALMFGAFHAHAANDGTDSHCVVGKNNSLFNQCNYSVDVGFCVENPRQTKHFYDNSKAFKCPGGTLIALPTNLQDGNILHGNVHWWACSTKHRASFKWRYVEGVGYRGYCFKEGADQAQPVRDTAPTAPTATADCQALENRLRGPKSTTHQMRRAEALTALEFLDRNCGSLSPQQRVRARKINQETLIAAAAECKQSGGQDCASSGDVSSPSSPSPGRQPQATTSTALDGAGSSGCAAEQTSYENAFLSEYGETYSPDGSARRVSARETLAHLRNTRMSMFDGASREHLSAVFLPRYEAAFKQRQTEAREDGTPQKKTKLAESVLNLCLLRARVSGR